MLNLAIIGYDPEAHENSLATVTMECCKRHFSVSSRVLPETDVVWFCYDAPIGADDAPDVEWVLNRIRVVMPDVRHALVLISSQLPVGTTALLESEFPDHRFAYSPENIRVAHGVADFENQARVVVGRRDTRFDRMLAELFAPFTSKLMLTDPETSECAKHFLNALLATNICFANEMARFCAKVGADADMVSASLLSERRIASCAPLKPGKPFGGGHLSRDIHVVCSLAKWHNLELPLIQNIKRSNES